MKILRYISVAILALAIAACQGPNDPFILTPEDEKEDNGGGNQDDNQGDDNQDNQPEEGYIISVDKTTIEADGKDVANFTVTDPEGNNLMEDYLSSIYFRNVNTGERLPRKSTGFTSVMDGEYEFVATYKGTETSNSVKITVQNRRNYETYKQRVAIYQLTGTWCTYCPSMVAGLDGLSEKWKQHSIVMAAHASSQSQTDPFAISAGSGDLGSVMLSAFRGEGYPSCVYDLVELSGERASSTIESILESYLINYPATCGVKISSTKREVMAGGENSKSTITIEAEVTSSTGGTYDLGYILLLDNQSYSSGTSIDGMYHDIICAFSSNVIAMSDQRFTLSKGESKSKSFTIEGFPAQYSDKDLRVVVFALSQRDGKTINDNLAVCQMGGSADYELN